jgi:hypothetical protein
MNNVNADHVSPVKPGAILQLCARWLVIVVLLTLAGVVVASFLVPRKYFSKVTMELPRPFERQMPTFGPGQPPAPEYIQAQLAILQKTEILYPVIERLDLRKDYAPSGTRISQQEAYQRLRASMKLQEVRNTGLVEIGIFDTDAQRAANIANTIATVYQEVTSEATNAEIARGEDQLRAVRADQRKQVEEASRVAMEIRARNGIADPDPEKESAVLSLPEAAAGSETPVRPAPIAAKTKMTEYVDAKQRMIQARKVLESMEIAYAQVKIADVVEVRWPGARVWERAEKAEQPENRIVSLVDNVLH